jgi:hypothetical protein
LLLIRNSPPTPPSKLAYTDKKTESSFREDLMKLMKNPNFILIALSFSFNYSVYTTLGAAVGPLTKSFDYTPTDVSVFGGAFILAGLIGSFVHAIYLDKYKRFKF